MRRLLSRIGLFLLAQIAALPAGVALADSFGNAASSDLFGRYIGQPLAPDVALQYASLTGNGGDIEAAIGALERLVFFSPETARLRFELGMLYYRLGSYEMARGYFRSALKCRDATPAMAAQIDEFLQTIERRLRIDQVSGFFQTGLRYQTNASLGAAVQPGLFNSGLFAQGDWNWFATVGINYVHDFGNQRGDVFEASLLLYDAQQFHLTDFDVGYAEVRAGPRFGIFLDTLQGASFKPYVVATGALLGDAPYLGAGGGGATVHLNLGAVALDPYAEVVQRSFQDSTVYPRASGLSGTLSTIALPVGGQLYGSLAWQVKAAVSHSSASFNPFGYDHYWIDVALPWTVRWPWDGPAVVLTPSFGVGQWLYASPDPLVDPFTTERDNDWHAGLGVDAPLWRDVRLGVQMMYREIRSNIPIYSARDFSITVGPGMRF